MIRVQFKIQDGWIGYYWKLGKLHPVFRWMGSSPVVVERQFDIWICLIPFLPIHIRHTWIGRAPDPASSRKDQ